jgi:glucoamylase
MTENLQYAPGGPGIPPRWTSSAKSGVGTSSGGSSRVWFTISHGILDEIYYPRIDLACTRDMGLIVTDGKEFLSDEKRDTDHQQEYLSPGVPAYHLTNTCGQKRFKIEKEILTDPLRDSLVQKVQFTALQGELSDYHIYVILAPHIHNQGYGNTAWVGDYKGYPMLFAQREGITLALASSTTWLKRSAGFAGVSDGWQDLAQHKQMTWEYDRAENGNVALSGEVDLAGCKGSFVLAIGFGTNPYEAGQRALSSLYQDFSFTRSTYIDTWRSWLKKFTPPDMDQKHDLYPISMMVLRVHEAKSFAGGLIASLSIPWGSSKGDNDLGGYHLVWPRDLVESTTGLLAAGAKEDALRVLQYLEVTQEADGHWPQNMWLDGSPYWNGIQLDETAFPILLIDMAYRLGALPEKAVPRFWAMVHRAASFIARMGPVTQQDRWEEDPGYSVFTLAVEIAGLLAAADLAEMHNEKELAEYLRQTADTWYSHIDDWTYVVGTKLAKQVGVPGYYVRITPPDVAEAASPAKGFVPIKNRPPGQTMEPAKLIVSPDALALVRFGLRAPDDPRMVNTLKVIDACLKVETPVGPAWHRYTDDGYGEHPDGTPFDGTGVGQLWPLLTGERAMYELAAGHVDTAQALLKTMEAFANPGGMFPEQVWDGPDIPDKELFFGKPSGSAMPLVWAHAEYIKLRRSLREGIVFDLPPQTVQRYLEKKTTAAYESWRFNNKIRKMSAGKTLRIEVLAPAMVHWSADGWKTVNDITTRNPGADIQVADLPTQELPAGTTIDFTFDWPEARHWEGQNFRVQIIKEKKHES